MSTNATTKQYIQLLMCNFLGTLFILLSLDLNVTTAIHSQLLATLPFLLLPPTSVAIAVMLLRSWANSNPERSTPLPQFSPEAMNHEDIFANKMVLVGFFHVLMVLSRVLALASGSCIVFFISANDTPNAPLNQSCWASFGLCWFWLSIITFGHCLLVHNINKNHWGLFGLLFDASFFAIKFTVVIFSATTNLFEAIRGSLKHFQAHWGGRKME
ncbi:hypothetical protein F5051DRAFT_507554 [Lentinula edodes]|nr:hypothetical protein F5051DRAFT_507554 [Lentinula edodes]